MHLNSKGSNIFGDIFPFYLQSIKDSSPPSAMWNAPKLYSCKSYWPTGLGVSFLRFQDSHKINIIPSVLWVSTDNGEHWLTLKLYFEPQGIYTNDHQNGSSDEMFKAALYKKAINAGKVDITCDWFPFPVCKCLHN